ncbi:hypothetical protein LJK87_07995 [Paenibacillus sp. P25]|nr:hypothetical protein LJK87_07995 [Paenibacillus sp. P25]
MDHALKGRDGRSLALCVAGMLGLFVIQWAANSFRIRYTNNIGQKVIYDLRHDLFSHIQRLSFRFFDKRPAGSILVRITNYVNSLQDLLTNGAVNLMIDCVQLIGIIVILLFFNVKLGAAIIVTVPIMFLVSTKSAGENPQDLAGVPNEAVADQRAPERMYLRDQGNPGFHAGEGKYRFLRRDEQGQSQDLEPRIDSEPVL